MVHMDGIHPGYGFAQHKGYPVNAHVEALRRELFEELDIVARVGELTHIVTHAYPEKTVELHFYRCEFDGEPKPMMGQGMRWVRRDELAGLPFPEADRSLITLLCGVRLLDRRSLGEGG